MHHQWRGRSHSLLTLTAILACLGVEKTVFAGKVSQAAAMLTKTDVGSEQTSAGRDSSHRYSKGLTGVHISQKWDRDAEIDLPTPPGFVHKEDWSHVMELDKRSRYDEPWPTRNYTQVEEDGGGGEGEDTSEGADDNCTHPRQPMPRYNDSCDFVHAECEGKVELIDYLAFVLCDLPKAQVYI